MTNQGGIQSALRASTGTAHTYEGDWHAYWDSQSIAAGPFNGRMLAWIKSVYPAAPDDVQGAMNYYAIQSGFANWASMNDIVTGTTFMLKADGASYMLKADGTSKMTKVG